MAGPTKLKIGSQLDRFPGRSFNLLIDGYNRQRSGLPRTTPGSAGGGQTLTVTAVNETGEVLEYGHCVAIEGLYVAVESVAVQVYNRPVLKAKIPSDSLDHTVIGVSTGTVAAGGVGTFTIMGATWIRWKKTDAAHKFAKLDTAMVSYDPAAKSAGSGYPILASEAVGGLPDTVWAIVLLGGGGGGGGNIRFARVTTAFDAAAGPLAADWTDGEVKFQNDSTGELDDDPTDCKNSWIGTGWVENSQVAVDTGYSPPRIVSGTCAAVDWGD